MRLDLLETAFGGGFSVEKALNKKTFHQDDVISLSGVVVR